MKRVNLKALILLYFALFALFYVFVIPPYESPDEIAHLGCMNFMGTQGRMPNMMTEDKWYKGYINEGCQPPLYYFAGTALNIALQKDKSVDFTPLVNKKNVEWGGQVKYVPTWDHVYHQIFAANADRFNFYLLRSFSVLFGLLNIFFVFKLSSLFLKDEKWALLPAALLATLPQFTYISGMISNDNLASLFGTLSLYYLLKIIDQPEKIGHYILAGIFLGCGMMTKLTTIAFMPGAVVLFAYLMLKNEKLRTAIFRNTLALFGLTGLVSAFLFIRNYLVYGEFLGTKMIMHVALSVDPKLLVERSLFSWFFLFPFLPGLFVSFVGAFGYSDLLLPIPFYLFYLLLLSTVVYGFIKHQQWSENELTKIGFAAFFVFLAFASLVTLNLKVPSYQGRYLFPVLSLVAILAAIGLKAAAERLSGFISIKRFTSLLIAALVLIDLVTAFLVINFYYQPGSYL